MAVTHVATGTVANSTGATTLAVSSPAGLTNDLLVFLLTAHDYSDGDYTAVTPPTTVTEIDDGDPQRGMDARTHVAWSIADQDAGEAYTFGTRNASEEFKGVCLRYRGHNATTPIVNFRRHPGIAFPANHCDLWGGMLVGFAAGTQTFSAMTPPSGWTERVDSPGAARSMYVADYAWTHYPQNEAVFDSSAVGTATTVPLSLGISFSIEPASSPTYTISGVTRDVDGNVLVSCEVTLFREVSTGVYQFVATQISDGTTGAYSFTLYENTAAFMVYARKDGSPAVADATNNAETPA